MTRNDAVTNLAFFLLAQTGSVCGRWQGRMKAAEQRATFGMYLGKGTIIIDGASESLVHWVSVCFGQDYDVTYERAWSVIGDTAYLSGWRA